jgi:hypothetical protein
MARQEVSLLSVGTVIEDALKCLLAVAEQERK